MFANRVLIILLLLISFGGLAQAYPSDSVSLEEIKQTIGYLSGLSSRVPGYPGSITAENYVYSCFEKYGLKNLGRDKFKVSVPVEKYAEMTFDGGKTCQLHCLWPNLLKTSTVNIEKAEIVYGGNGNIENLNGKQIEGAVILLDFNSGISWLNIAKLGARAIVFIEPEDTFRKEAEQKFLKIPLDVPRFWISKNDAKNLVERLRSGKKTLNVKLKARMDWEEVEQNNILGYVKGTDPELSKKIIVLSSYYDSISAVPALAPGAETTCGIASLLQLAKYFSQNRPKYTVLFLATSAHFIKLTGIDYFLFNHIKSDIADPGMKEPINIELFVGLDLTSQNSTMGIFAELFHSSLSSNYRETVDIRMSAFSSRMLETISGKNLPQGLNPGMAVQATKVIKGVSPKTLLHCDMGWSLDWLPAIRRGVTAMGFITTADGRLLTDTPLDKPGQVNYNNIFNQARMLVEILSSALNTGAFTEPVASKYADLGVLLELKLVSFDPRKGYEPNNPRKGAFGYLDYYGRESLSGVRGMRFYKADENGICRILNEAYKGCADQTSFGFELDPETGDITYAPDKGVYGNEQFPQTLSYSAKLLKQKITLFSCETLDIYDFFDPQYLIRLPLLDVLGKDNAIPPSYGYSDMGLNFYIWGSFNEPYAVVFAEKNKAVKAIMSSTSFGKRCLLINSESSESKDSSEGSGFYPDAKKAVYYPTLQAARDMFNLDEYRLNVLRNRGIKDKFLEESHAETKVYLDKAAEAKNSLKWDEYSKYAQQALGIESRLYPDIKNTLNDVVRGIIFYMVMLLPFAFFSERLFFGYSSIGKRIITITAIFLAVYLVMRNVHPAFKLAIAPEIILISFVVLVLAFIVFFVIQGKFEEQIGKIRKDEAGGLYVADVGRISAVGVAFSLGISNMKRYKMRTFLTATTVILLTFTILSFTSIQSRMSFMKLKQGGLKPLFDGFLFRDPRGWPLELAALDYIKNEFGKEKDITIAPRAEFNFGYEDAKTPGDAEVALELKSGNAKTISVGGIIGLTPEEANIVKYPMLKGRWLSPGELYSCILPDEAAKRLHVDVGDRVSLYGRNFTLVGIFDSARIRKLKDLNNESLGPTNLAAIPPAMLTDIRDSRSQGLQATPLASGLVHVDAGDFIIVPYDFLMKANGMLVSVAVKFNDKPRLEQAIKDLMKRLSNTLYVGTGDEVYTYSSLKTTKIGGMAILFVPIFIAGLIILNTMLGSVYERINEIGIYSSVGLAPSHISTLFLGESCVYSVLGAIIGYLLGQVVVKLLSAFHMLSGLNLNYSSLSTVFVTLLVIFIVYLSTLYPAKKAADLSVPDVTRKWNVPSPKGDDLRFQFPFSVSGIEVLGLFNFMKSYFESYTETSVGNFYTSGTKLRKTDKGYTVDNMIWLAPYELGVKQRFALEAVETEDKKIFEIMINITRLEGQSSDWMRLNRQFLNNLRKQFLVWRTVAVSIKQQYKKEGELLLANS